jgi:hypothetical protein
VALPGDSSKPNIRHKAHKAAESLEMSFGEASTWSNAVATCAFAASPGFEEANELGY